MRQYDGPLGQTYVILVALGLWPARTPVGGWLGAAGFWREERDGRAGQFEGAALDGCVDGEFPGVRGPLRLMVWLARVARWPGRSP